MPWSGFYTPPDGVAGLLVWRGFSTHYAVDNWAGLEETLPTFHFAASSLKQRI
ncbi:MAG: hypothetical protein LAO03_06590 [Acidobacteriia bacterium]|nr:hypothetical protein [Terriglobia bacterium]